MTRAQSWSTRSLVATLSLVFMSSASLQAAERSAEDQAKVDAVTQLTTDFSKSEPFERLSGGATTTLKALNRDVFSHPSANMSFEKELDFKLGNGLFKKVWVSSPSSTKASDGLGPLYNARSCQRCHIKDGRGHPSAANFPDDTAVSMFLRLSVPPRTEEEQRLIATHRATVIPEPTYGGQLQDFSIQGIPAEGRMHIIYEDQPVTLADGTVIKLQKPTYTVTDLGYGPMDPEVMLSPRIAPQMLGLGLLEAIPEDEILAWADPEDLNGDGIRGVANQVWSGYENRVMLGRFGLKAGKGTIMDQSAGAFSGDIGISNPLVPGDHGECTEAQRACRNAPGGGDDANGGHEISQEMLDLVVFYSRNLAVPARRDVDDPQVLKGKVLFYASGCAACHRPKFVTARRDDMPEQSFQLIWPYSDLLLHDMGEGLADSRPEGLANGQQWRTPPLCGIGLTETVSGHTRFLHDGRARNLLEAVLWHGGEAETARNEVISMSAEDREALLAFLNSL